MIWLIRFIYRMQAFSAPVLFFGLIAVWVYSRGERYAAVALILLIAGNIAGIVMAEYIRRKYELETFFARIYGPNEMDEK